MVRQWPGEVLVVLGGPAVARRGPVGIEMSFSDKEKSSGYRLVL